MSSPTTASGDLEPTPTDPTLPFTATNPQFTLYTHPIGPNGWKISQILSALHLTYRPVFLKFGAGPSGMKHPTYLTLNPNGRIPALIDHSNNNFCVWESLAIILYVCKKHNPSNLLWAESVEEQAEVEMWLSFQVSGQGPYLGQAMWFRHYHEEEVGSAVRRYVEESRRVLRVVEERVGRRGGGGWLCLGRVTVADVSFLQWWKHAGRVGIVIEREFPEVWRWMGRVEEVEGVREGGEGAVIPVGDVGVGRPSTD